MRNIAAPFLILGLIGGMFLFPARADNFLSNTDFKDSLQGWHGDADRAFLAKDGTEGAEGDAEVITVMKLPLSHGSSRAVSQDFETRDKQTSLHVSVEVFASPDFVRSKYPNDYTVDWKADGTIWYWSDIAFPHADFWIRVGGSSWCYKLSDLKPGAWTTVSGELKGLPNDQDRTVCFCVPSGTGAVYIRNPVVTP